MPSVYNGGGCHPSKSCAEAPADVPVDDVNVDMEMEAADASDDVNVNKVTSIKAVTLKHDVDDDDDDDDDAHYRMLSREKEQEDERLAETILLQWKQLQSLKMLWEK